MTTLPTLHWFGNKAANQLIVYLHGFAVNWTSKKMFTDVATALAEAGQTSVLFDISDYDQQGNASYLSLSAQRARVAAVAADLRRRNPQAKISLIAHSLGCILTTSLGQDLLLGFEKILLLAPAGNRPGPRIEAEIRARPDASRNGNQTSFIRKNGVSNTFSQAYIKELDIDVIALYKKHWPLMPNLRVILAAGDQYPAQLRQLLDLHRAETLADSDHNFTGVSRTLLSDRVKAFFIESDH